MHAYETCTRHDNGHRIILNNNLNLVVGNLTLN